MLNLQTLKLASSVTFFVLLCPGKAFGIQIEVDTTGWARTKERIRSHAKLHLVSHRKNPLLSARKLPNKRWSQVNCRLSSYIFFDGQYLISSKVFNMDEQSIWIWFAWISKLFEYHDLVQYFWNAAVSLQVFIHHIQTLESLKEPFYIFLYKAKPLFSSNLLSALFVFVCTD